MTFMQIWKGFQSCQNNLLKVFVFVYYSFKIIPVPEENWESNQYIQ